MPVLVADVTRGPTVVTLSLPGELRSPGEAALAAEVAGTVDAVPARVGSEVAAGALLVALDGRSFEIARRAAAARLEQAAAQQAVQQAALQRVRVTTRRMLEVAERDPGALSSREVEDAKLALAEAEAMSQSAAADHALRAAELDGAELDLARTRVRAPMAGVVVRQEVRIGQRVAAGTPLVTLAVRGNLEAVLDAGEAQQVPIGGRVVLSVPARPELSIEALVAAVVPAADGSSRTQRVRVDLVDPPPGWIPGLAVRGQVEVARLDDALQVPRDAINNGAVFTVVEGKAHKVPVVVRHDNGEMLVVEAELAAGDDLVVRGNEALQDGAEVKVIAVEAKAGE